MINDHKAQFGEWKIQLSWSDNIEIMIGIETDYIIDKLLNLFCKNIKKVQKNHRKEVSLFTIALICCIIIFIKYV